MKDPQSTGLLVNKMILVVLTLILGCLVVLIVRQGRTPMTPPRDVSTSAPAPQVPWPRPKSASNAAPLRPTATTAPPAATGAPSGAEMALPPSRSVSTQAARPSLPAGLPVPAAFGPTNELPPTGTAISRPVTATISGKARLRGAPPPERNIFLDDCCAGLYVSLPISTKDYLVAVDGGLANVFVYLRSPGTTNSLAVEDEVARRFRLSKTSARWAPGAVTAALDIARCQLTPAVVALQTNWTLRIKNSDPCPHDLSANPRLNKGFTAALAKKDSTFEHSFAAAEALIPIFSPTRSWMVAYVGVAEHPWYAVTDQNGAFRFSGALPAGQYTLVAVHPKAGELTQEVTLVQDERKSVTFLFEPR